jgi:dsRNA-specific ribonuclease
MHHYACLRHPNHSPPVLALAFLHPSWVSQGKQTVQRLQTRDSARAKFEGISRRIWERSPILSEGHARLEYLGDSVLKLALTEQLVRKCGLDEHLKLKDLQLQRSMLENNELLGLLALEQVFALSLSQSLYHCLCV